MGKIGVIFDTSASLNHQSMRDTLASEIVAINDEVGAEEIHVRYVDSRVRGEQRFRRGETLLPASFEPIGGGGTDMRVGVQAFENDDEPCMCVIMLTDGETPWPASEPTIPLIVCCTTQEPIPVGMEVRINVGQ
jgi:predicted metal-dependent peptidase